jgi:signal transduction histidine kinase
VADAALDVQPAIDDPAAMARAFGFADPVALGAGCGSNVWAPLVVGGRTIGVLALCCATLPIDRTLIQALASRVAIAVENARLYEEAQSAIRMREEVLAIATHDLRNPLAAIFTSAEVLQKTAHGPDLLRVKSVLRGAERMRALIDRLLVAARIEAGELGIQSSREWVEAIILEALEMFRDTAAKKQIQIAFAPPPERIEVDCDREWIVEALANVFQNAVKFTPEGGAIAVRVQATTEEVLLSVSNTGQGIAPDVLPRVFERYRQAPNAPRTGAGLGLYIVKGIVEAHGGRVAIESAPGRWTTVSVTLPRAAMSARPDTEAPAP